MIYSHFLFSGVIEQTFVVPKQRQLCLNCIQGRGVTGTQPSHRFVTHPSLEFSGLENSGDLPINLALGDGNVFGYPYCS